MPRRSRRQSQTGVGKKSSFSSPSNVRSTRLQRFDISPVARQEFLDEGNKALQKLLARDLGYQRARLHAERPVSIPRRRPPRISTVSGISTAFEDAIARSLIPSRNGLRTALTRSRGYGALGRGVQSLRDAVICARRAIRRELVFASGSAGSKKRVVNRASPSSVKC